LHPVPDAELHEVPPDVGLDGRFAEVELLADLGVGQAAHHQGHDLALAVGQQIQPGGRRQAGDLRPGREPVQQPPGYRGGQQRVSGGHHADARDDVRRPGVLEQEPAGARG
jgi:hypothetical protein